MTLSDRARYFLADRGGAVRPGGRHLDMDPEQESAPAGDVPFHPPARDRLNDRAAHDQFRKKRGAGPAARQRAEAGNRLLCSWQRLDAVRV